MADQPTLRRRELGRLLRQLREQAGLTAEEAGRQVDLSDSTMSRLERGTTRIRPLIVNALLMLYQAPEETRQTVQELLADAHQRGWWQEVGTLPPGLGGYIALEADATTLRTYDTHLIHGMLQTADYARAQASFARPDIDPVELDRVVQVRIKRQDRLTDASAPLDLTALIEEAALLRPVGGPVVMRQQLATLLRLMGVPTVTIRVLPTRIGAHEGLDGSFSILTFDSGNSGNSGESRYPNIGHVDTRVGSIFVERTDQVAALTHRFDLLMARALPAGATRTAIMTAIDTLAPAPEAG